MTAMHGLTVYQPWADLIAHGHKRYEFRGWAAPKRIVGKRIAIHAAARKVNPAAVLDIVQRIHMDESFLGREALALLNDRPIGQYRLSCIVATARLARVLTPAEVAAEAGFEGGNDSDRVAHFNYGWELTNVVRMPNIPHRGAQGFWYVDPHFVEGIREIEAKAKI